MEFHFLRPSDIPAKWTHFIATLMIMIKLNIDYGWSFISGSIKKSLNNFCSIFFKLKIAINNYHTL